MGTRLAFSAQGLAAAAMAVLATVYMGKFYVDVVLLPAGLFAIAITAGPFVSDSYGTPRVESRVSMPIPGLCLRCRSWPPAFA
ncbi:MAG: hypothetical protein AAGF92_03080 [Myxococcota bacterium]